MPPPRRESGEQGNLQMTRLDSSVGPHGGGCRVIRVSQDDAVEVSVLASAYSLETRIG